MAMHHLVAVLGLYLIGFTNCSLDGHGYLVPPTLRPPGNTVQPPRITPLFQPVQQFDTYCNDTAANIVFVLDSSASVGPRNFVVMKSFVKSIVERLRIGIDASSVGILTYSRYPDIKIHLYDYRTEADLLTAIDAVPYENGVTETDTALDLLRHEGFLGAQPTLPNIAIMITDGKSTHPNRTAVAAEKVLANNITMFAIGIGPEININELKTIGSKPDVKHVFTVLSFDSLAKIVGTISNATCNVKAPTGVIPPITVTTEGDCNQTFADIVFVLDSSGSVGLSDFSLIIQFVMNVTDAMDIGENATKVAVITFQNYPTVRLSLDSYDTKHDVIDAISRIPYSQGGTNTALALELLTNQGFVGGRIDAPDIVIVITDGKSDNPDLTKAAADEAKENHTTIFAIGIGDNIDRIELNNIASDPDVEYVFYVHNFTGLASIVNKVAQTTCAVPEKETATPPLPTTTSPTTTPKPTTTTMATTTSSPCAAKVADVIFVLDSSGSLGAENFAKMKQFMTQTVDIFDVGDDFTRVGLIAFNQHATLEFGLTQYNNSFDLDTAILNIRYSDGGTNTGEALQLLRQAFMNDRPNNPDIAVIITDGLSADPVATMQQARLAREAGATLIAIGVGNGTDNKELENIASPNPTTNGKLVFQVGNFEALQRLHYIIALVACGAGYGGNNNTQPSTNATDVNQTMSINCTDAADADCGMRGRDICTDYQPWAKAHCPLTCGFCQGPPTTPAPCVDHLSNCHEYGTYICTQVSLIRWTKDNCRAYCGLCVDSMVVDSTVPTRALVTVSAAPVLITTQKSSVTCTNTIANCGEYGGLSMCHADLYSSWAKSHCAEYCGFCTNYIISKPIVLPNHLTCPGWKLPKACQLMMYDDNCCPLPLCPPGYMLTVEIPEP